MVLQFIKVEPHIVQTTKVCNRKSSKDVEKKVLRAEIIAVATYNVKLGLWVQVPDYCMNTALGRSFNLRASL